MTPYKHSKYILFSHITIDNNSHPSVLLLKEHYNLSWQVLTERQDTEVNDVLLNMILFPSMKGFFLNITSVCPSIGFHPPWCGECTTYPFDLMGAGCHNLLNQWNLHNKYLFTLQTIVLFCKPVKFNNLYYYDSVKVM